MRLTNSLSSSALLSLDRREFACINRAQTAYVQACSKSFPHVIHSVSVSHAGLESGQKAHKYILYRLIYSTYESGQKYILYIFIYTHYISDT